MDKNEILNIIINYELLDSERDALNIACAMNVDELADFASFLLLGDWSRNITVLEKELQKDENIIALFKHIEMHCKK